jgi:hypothetical protein
MRNGMPYFCKFLPGRPNPWVTARGFRKRLKIRSFLYLHVLVSEAQVIAAQLPAVPGSEKTEPAFSLLTADADKD